MSWRHENTHKVISDDCYQRLSNRKHWQYVNNMPVTHVFDNGNGSDDDEDMLLSLSVLAAAEMLSRDSGNCGCEGSSCNCQSEPDDAGATDTFSGFDGGESGGGGASGDY